MKDHLSEMLAEALYASLNAKKQLGKLQESDLAMLCDRVVVCLRACDGIADPAAELARLRECEAGAAVMREAAGRMLSQAYSVGRYSSWLAMCEDNSEADARDEVAAALATGAGAALLAEAEAVRKERDYLRDELNQALAAMERMRDATATHERILGELQTRINDLNSIRIRVIEERDAALRKVSAMAGLKEALELLMPEGECGCHTNPPCSFCESGGTFAKLAIAECEMVSK